MPANPTAKAETLLPPRVMAARHRHTERKLGRERYSEAGLTTSYRRDESNPLILTESFLGDYVGEVCVQAGTMRGRSAFEISARCFSSHGGSIR